MTTIYDFLPHQLLSSIARKLARCQNVWIKNRLIRWFQKQYNVDLADAMIQNPEVFRSFHDFFTRELRPGTRSIAAGEGCVVSPADGVLSAYGEIHDRTLVQAKGRYYALSQLLMDEHESTKFANGSYYTVYLSPRDYHRVHMPLAGSLVSMRYVPGRLFPVNRQSTQRVNQLFARNERMICYFETAVGPMAVIFVGALLVGQMSVVWEPSMVKSRSAKTRDWHYDGRRRFEKGEEIGHFTMGSTVIVLLPAAPSRWEISDDLNGVSVKVGQAMADFGN
jgi:phosphatidylserine decarboxylase